MDGFEAEVVECVSRLLDLVDLGGAELIERALVPVWHAVDRVVMQPLALDAGLPVGAGRASVPLHFTPPRWRGRWRRNRRGWSCRTWIGQRPPLRRDRSANTSTASRTRTDSRGRDSRRSRTTG